MALPTNSILFIKGEVPGINLLIASPVRKAPIIASTPANSDNTAPAYTRTSTKTY